MELTNEFSVDAPVDQAWAVLLDVERIAPCMPGATLNSFDGDAFTGTVQVKLGPVNMTYAGKGHFVSKDAENHQVVIQASGKDSRGKGTAAATVTASLLPDGSGTRVQVVTKLNITGAAAQFGRGMIADVSGRLINQFATCLTTTMAASATVAAPEPAATLAEPSAAGTAAEPAKAGTAAEAASAATAASSATAGKSAPADEPAHEGGSDTNGGAAAKPAPSAAESGAVGDSAPASETAAAAKNAAAGKPAGEGQPARVVEPIDLLAVSGVRRFVPYALAAVAVIVIAIVLINVLA